MSVFKRLENLERLIRSQTPRQIVVLVNGNEPDDAALDALLKELDVQDDELAILVSRFVETEGLPRIASVSLN